MSIEEMAFYKSEEKMQRVRDNMVKCDTVTATYKKFSEDEVVVVTYPYLTPKGKVKEIVENIQNVLVKTKIIAIPDSMGVNGYSKEKLIEILEGILKGVADS